MEFDIVVYHEHCSDGIAAAWVVRNKNERIQLVGCMAGSDIDTTKVDIKDKNIVYVDICPSVTFLQNNINALRSITILDHHISAYKAIENSTLVSNEKLKCVFDMNRSGCMITWDYFFTDSESGLPLPRPWFINYIGDRDLWKFELPNSKDISTGLFELKLLNFKGLDDLFLKDSTALNEMQRICEVGRIANELKDKIIEFEVKRAVEYKFVLDEPNVEYRVWAYRGPDEYRSDIGNALLKRKFNDGNLPDFCINYRYDIERNMHYLSLRGGDHSPDLTLLCKKYGGGGHKKACGFEVDASKCSLNEFLRKITY
jgi:oligoribonuclease NrnB/cAMP/cGMP phosphodiesterase (DHH superfamily)